MTRQAEALITATYLAGTNTRGVKRALGALFKGSVAEDVVSRTWRKLKADWESWDRREMAAEDIVRLILDGTVVKVRLDRRAARISLLVVLGVRRDGQKVLLAVRSMGGESEAAWRAVLPSAETAAMLFWSLLASGQITMRKVDGWQSLAEPPASMPLGLVA